MKFFVISLSKRTVFIGVMFVFIIAFFVEFYINNYLIKDVFSAPLSEKIVLIDPGHGGIDAGASDNGAVEKEINLEVAKLLQEYIEVGGGAAYLTRTDDSNTADPDRNKNVSQKMSDLRERKLDIKRLNADVFVSIHMNRFAEPQYRGAQIFYDDDSPENKRLAESVQQSLKDVIKDGNKRTAKATGNSIFVLKNNDVPSVLIECGFLSNPEEAKLLLSPEYRRKVAWGIYVGLVRYFSN